MQIRVGWGGLGGCYSHSDTLVCHQWPIRAAGGRPRRLICLQPGSSGFYFNSLAEMSHLAVGQGEQEAELRDGEGPHPGPAE